MALGPIEPAGSEEPSSASSARVGCHHRPAPGPPEPGAHGRHVGRQHEQACREVPGGQGTRRGPCPPPPPRRPGGRTQPATTGTPPPPAQTTTLPPLEQAGPRPPQRSGAAAPARPPPGATTSRPARTSTPFRRPGAGPPGSPGRSAWSAWRRRVVGGHPRRSEHRDHGHRGGQAPAQPCSTRQPTIPWPRRPARPAGSRARPRRPPPPAPAAPPGGRCRGDDDLVPATTAASRPAAPARGPLVLDRRRLTPAATGRSCRGPPRARWAQSTTLTALAATTEPGRRADPLTPPTPE